MALYWGVEAASPLDRGVELAAMIAQGDQRICDEGMAAPGDLVVVVAGTPGGRGATNRVLVHRVGEPDASAPASVASPSPS